MSTTDTGSVAPADLKARIAPMAESEGKTPHAWMVDALRAQVALADLRQAFVDDARRSASEVDAVDRRSVEVRTGSP